MVVAAKQTVRGKGFNLEDGEQAAKFLVRAGEGLASSLDYETTLETVAHIAVPSLTDVGFLEMIQDGRFKAVAAAHADVRKEGWLRKLTVTSGAASPPTTVRAFRTGQPVIVKTLSDRELAEFAQQEGVPLDPRTIDGIHQIGPGSGISIPLVARGRTLGVLSLGRLGATRPFAKHELSLIRRLARQCAQAVDNARMFNEVTEAARASEESIATTSHELRTPLSEIKGFVTTLLRSDTEWDKETRTDFLREIDRDADRLDALISDLLEMSRLAKDDYLPLEPTPTLPVALVNGALEGMRFRLSGAEVQIDSEFWALPAVRVDARRIEQVIANLIENAIKYASGSDIHIWGRVVDAGTTVEIVVDDDGPGIPVEDLQHVFERHYRGTRRERSEIPGTGLGLTIARKIVERHGGRIQAENRSGGGARFIIGLPAA